MHVLSTLALRICAGGSCAHRVRVSHGEHRQALHHSRCHAHCIRCEINVACALAPVQRSSCEGHRCARRHCESGDSADNQRSNHLIIWARRRGRQCKPEAHNDFIWRTYRKVPSTWHSARSGSQCVAADELHLSVRASIRGLSVCLSVVSVCPSLSAVCLLGPLGVCLSVRQPAPLSSKTSQLQTMRPRNRLTASSSQVTFHFTNSRTRAHSILTQRPLALAILQVCTRLPLHRGS